MIQCKSKLTAAAVAALLVISLTGQSFAAVNPFTDITEHSARDKILALYEKGIVKGVGNERFAPGTTVTAAQGIQMLVNALGLNLDAVRFIKEPKATDYFPKADNNAWYAEALIIAAVNGIELPADLDPKECWTKEKFTHYLVRAMELHNSLPLIKLNPVAIADEDQITVDYSGSIQRAIVVYGILSLKEDGTLNPKAEITRAEAAAEVYNALEYLRAHPAPTTES
ncbi:S-layer homology domain-containing protein [Sinanaerobacter chloroacetimidivorans]|uniref:S-layer homology domain-containing protein n=1 Tax=Sinanaerobacter chloroacetimidivorans TaxID=2818044 RepID=UPI001D05335C|nr:S-layer homology domain-containing protein [Sinanaerobacter chloroacetimidivorans]